MSIKNFKCFTCDQEAKYRCSNCKKIFYCSEKCQEGDWVYGNHENVCEVQKIGFIKVKQNTVVRPGKKGVDEITLEKQLGSGGFGQVWTGARNGTKLVVKLFDTNNIGTMREFINEVYIHKIFASINKPEMPICSKHARCGMESFVDRKSERLGVVVFDSPLLDPVDLENFYKNRLPDQKKRNEKVFKDTVLKIALDVVDDVGTLHENGIFHRDIKPANTLVDQEILQRDIFEPITVFKSVLIDFNSAVPFKHDIDIFRDESGPLKGIADVLSKKAKKNLEKGLLPEFLTEPGFVGTPLYIDPEFFDGEVTAAKVDNLFSGRSPIKFSKKLLISLDIFAVGALLYEVETMSSGLDFNNLTNIAQKKLRDQSIPLTQENIRLQGFVELFAWKPPSNPNLILNDVIQEMTSGSLLQRTKPLVEYIDDIRNLLQN